MKEYVYAIMEIKGYKWGAILKWDRKPFWSRIFSKYKYGYIPFGLSNKPDEMKKFYDEYYAHIMINK